MKKSDVIKLAKDVEFAKLASDVIVCKAAAEFMAEKVDAYSKPIFAKYAFTDKHSGKPIVDAKFLYKADDDLMAAAYYAELLEAHVANGLNKAGVETCPALVAESNLLLSKKALVAYAADAMKAPEFNEIWSIEKFEALVDLLVKLVVQGVYGSAVTNGIYSGMCA